MQTYTCAVEYTLKRDADLIFNINAGLSVGELCTMKSVHILSFIYNLHPREVATDLIGWHKRKRKPQLNVVSTEDFPIAPVDYSDEDFPF